MTRQEITTEYTVDANGIIRNPGQFEGEMLYAPYFWDIYLNGGADEDDGDVLTFHVSSIDIEAFPELAGVKHIDMVQTDQGFVCCTSR
jgi:hypothetical protein